MERGKVHINREPRKGGASSGDRPKKPDAPLPQPKPGKGTSDREIMKSYTTRRASKKG